MMIDAIAMEEREVLVFYDRNDPYYILLEGMIRRSRDIGFNKIKFIDCTELSALSATIALLHSHLINGGMILLLFGSNKAIYSFSYLSQFHLGSFNNNQTELSNFFTFVILDQYQVLSIKPVELLQGHYSFLTFAPNLMNSDVVKDVSFLKYFFGVLPDYLTNSRLIDFSFSLKFLIQNGLTVQNNEPIINLALLYNKKYSAATHDAVFLPSNTFSRSFYLSKITKENNFAKPKVLSYQLNPQTFYDDSGVNNINSCDFISNSEGIVQREMYYLFYFTTHDVDMDVNILMTYWIEYAVEKSNLPKKMDIRLININKGPNDDIENLLNEAIEDKESFVLFFIGGHKYKYVN